MMQQDERSEQLKPSLSDYQLWLNGIQQNRLVDSGLIGKLEDIGNAVGACMKEAPRLSPQESDNLNKCLELARRVVASPQLNNTKELSDLGKHIYEKCQKPHWKTLGLELLDFGISALMVVSVFTPVLMPVSATLGLQVAKTMVDALISYVEKSEKLNSNPQRELKDKIDSLAQQFSLKN